ncbi:MAG: tetratricopeptide repeat protein, partial [Alphaproteobacteria bacterium]|nr:tetratricopeptide repeat protein [Alphaproteobacteria bacterium]
LAALVAAAVWLAEHPGQLRVDFLGYRIDSSAAFLIVAALGLAVASALGYRLWRAVRGAPGDFAVWRQERRRRQGYRALTQGMVAVAAGDAAEARRQAGKADVLLGEPPLTMLLSAQAAQLEGDEEAAKRYFTAMLDNPETAFLGMRGLLNQANKAGDRARALELAERAQELRPDTPWVLAALFDLQARADQWERALATLKRMARSRQITESAQRRRQAVIRLAQALAAEEAGKADAALEAARDAIDLAPDLVPALALATRLLAKRGKLRRATRTVERAWPVAAHPDLAAAYAAIPGDEPALDRFKALQRLAQLNPDHVESHLALAGAALDAQLWGAARNHLERARRVEPSARVFRLMARLEEAEHGDTAAARRLLEEAAVAPPAPQWVCQECGAVSTAWTALCGHCHAFDGLRWQAPVRLGLVGPAAPNDMARLANPTIGGPGG